MTRAEYDTLSRGQQNRYWLTINKHKKQAKEAAERVRAWHAKRAAFAGAQGTGSVGGRSFVHDGYDRDGYRGVSSATERLMQQAPRG